MDSHAQESEKNDTATAATDEERSSGSSPRKAARTGRSVSPTQRSLKDLRSRGATVAITEHWNAWIHQRQDLFQMFDLLALLEGRIVGVQVTSTANLSARRKKILANPIHTTWLGCGGRILLHGWSKKGARGERKLWTLTEREITSGA
jgi:hypothetical protein